MKVVCDRSSLLEAINLISGVVASRTPRPQLSGVRLTPEPLEHGGLLTLAATDAEIALTLRTERVEIEREGGVLIPADKLTQIVRAEDNEPTLTLEAEDDLLHIRGADAHFQLRGFPAADFIDIPGYAAVERPTSGARSFTARAGALGELVRRTLFAAAKENSRYAINGVLMERDGKKLEFVSTDGRRLALSRTTLDSAEGEPVAPIVPAKALSLLSKLLDDPNEPVGVAVSDQQIAFAVGLEPGADESTARAVLCSNLIEAAFPPYEDVIPKDQNIKVGFDRDTLASAVRRAALLTNEESRGVRMAFSGEGRTLELSSRVPEMGEAKIDVELSSYEGDDIEIGFNPSYIVDGLKVIDQPEVTVEMKAAGKPGLFRSGSDFLYVVMPVALQ